ncbi:MAG TPA: metallopeptidase TldD-related protein [Candidatus Acidoferrales bacterium]|nr:metallopeptidase TldD-related protein [Candidatus Acidoferrales bacterium]
MRIPLPVRSGILLASLLLSACAIRAAGRQKAATQSGSAATPSDPILETMRVELARSKANLKMENVPAPYYIEYQLSDLDEYSAEAAFGALRGRGRIHTRMLRVVVRVGDYKQDSYYGPGEGVADLAPLDDDPIALRWQLWVATDEAYKRANLALAMKKAALSRYTADQPFDDFAHAPAVRSIQPIVRLDFDAKYWEAAIQSATNLYRTDPKIESLDANVQFRAVNEYFVNTEGSEVREGYAEYSLALNGTTQAADGMRLSRGPYYVASDWHELPSAQQFQADTTKMVATLKALREAPLVDEEYRGPVLFSSDAASDVFAGMVGQNVLGIRPRPGESARTAEEYSSNYKSRVLPDFVSVLDDPTVKTFQGKSLTGSYQIDDEGVRAAKVPLIENGQLVNYLLGREPIRDFAESNGHGRAAPGRAPTPSIGTLIVESKQAVSPEDLKKKLMDLCRQEGKPYGYYAETLAGDINPRLLYRVYASDGHEELVRGAVFNELDTRALRNDLIAVGNDPLVSNREGAIPETVISPSILFDEIEVKRTDGKNAKLPDYPAPDLISRH